MFEVGQVVRHQTSGDLCVAVSEPRAAADGLMIQQVRCPRPHDWWVAWVPVEHLTPADGWRYRHGASGEELVYSAAYLGLDGKQDDRKPRLLTRTIRQRS